MALIKWDDETLSVGIKVIDNQHKVLVGYINELAELVEHNPTEKDIGNVFNQLVAYTQYHFKDEEAYFKGLNKKNLMLHKLQHKHFIEHLNQLKKKGYTAVTTELLEFLLDWLVTHIQCEDKKFIQAFL